MNSSNDSRPDGSAPQQLQQQEAADPERRGNSGEGAASALAQLKHQTRQHRRQAGDGDDPSGGPVA